MPFMQKDFSMTNTQIGVLASAVAITVAISGPIVGFISDRVRNKKAILVTACLLFSFLSLLHGATATFAMLFLVRLMMGLAEGPVYPIASSIMAIESSEKRRGFNMGFVSGTSNGVFGGFLAPLVIVALANAFGWQVAYYLTVIPGIILALLILFFIKNPKVEKAETSLSPGAKEIKEKVSIKEAFSNLNVWLCAIISISYLSFNLTFQIFGPLYLVNIKQMSPSTMSVIMAAFGAGIAIWSFVIPAISDRIGRKITSIIFGLPSILAPFAVMTIDNTVTLALLVFLFSTGLGVSGMMLNLIPVESVSIKLAAFTIGFIVASGEIFGGVLSPTLAGMAADVWGLAAPMFICTLAAFLAWFFSLFLKETAPVKVGLNRIGQLPETLDKQL
jgi:MFS transporter, ACS family, hexuronate transporter